MRHRDIALKLEAGEGQTLVQRIAQAIEKAIREGRLQPGAALPGSRALAEGFQVARKTVMAALEQLEYEGWLVTEPNRGTFVADKMPSETACPTETPATEEDLPSPGFDLPSRLTPLTETVTDALLMADGLPDSRLAPTEAMAKAYQRALRRHGTDLLQYGEPMGNGLLREAIAGWVSERHGVSISPDQVMITRGSRMALTLISMALLKIGDGVVVENPGNRGAWDTLRHCSNATLLPIPVDRQGLRVDQLEYLLKTTKVRALYLTPRRQFPTGVSLDPDRGKALLKLASDHRLAILEDDYDGAYHYGDSRPHPLLSLDGTGQVIHMGSLSKLLAPGIRIGFIIAAKDVVDRLARVRRNMEWQGDRVLEWAIADLIRDGVMAHHIRRVRRTYADRRDYLAERLSHAFGDKLAIEIPDGGLGLWVRVRDASRAESWIDASKQLGVVLHPPRHFFFAAAEPCFRMGFSQLDERELDESVRRMKCAWA